MTNNANATIEEFSRKYLSPSQKERSAVSARYEQLQKLLPGNDIFQSGSFRRETAVSPVHDLDVIWVMPPIWQSRILKAYSESAMKGSFTFDTSEPLSELTTFLEKEYAKIGVKMTIEKQSHSVRIEFEDEKFAIDVVPAIKSGQRNINNDDIYLVPELQKARHKAWNTIYEQRGKSVKWILSDPKFYIDQAKKLNVNPSYRKAVKFIKTWRRACNASLINFELQSFHLELVMAALFSKNPDLDLYSAIYYVLENLSAWLSAPKIPDAADSSVYVDSYLNDDTDYSQRQRTAAFAKLTLERFQTIQSDSSFEEIYSILRDCLKATIPWKMSPQPGSVGLNCSAERKNKYKNSPHWKDHKRNLPRDVLDRLNGPRPLLSDEQIKTGYDLTFLPDLAGWDFDYIKWLIVNTGVDALDKHRISGWRGFEFHDSDEGSFSRTEHTWYLGRHCIQCFVLKSGECVGFGQFFVNIRQS